MPAVAKMISDYNAFVAAICERLDEMRMTRLELDELAGLSTGYSGKLLGPRQVKAFGRMSLGSTLGAIGCKLLLVEDPEQTARIMARMTPRERPIRPRNPPKKSTMTNTPERPASQNDNSHISEDIRTDLSKLGDEKAQRVRDVAADKSSPSKD